MAKPREEKKEKKRFSGFVFRIAVAAAAVYLVVSFISGQIKVAEKQAELDEITVKVDQQLEENAELERLMEEDDEEAYIERVAREKLGYAKPHERVFLDLTGE